MKEKQPEPIAEAQRALADSVAQMQTAYRAVDKELGTSREALADAMRALEAARRISCSTH
jgi:DNA anti-recombination protein RmuC